MKQQLRNQQSGFVSIIMALVIMVLVSLIGLGFAFLARQNQQQNQNRLLSTQAFYAAESGVNDAVDYISKQVALGAVPSEKTDCNAPIAGTYSTAIGSTNPNIKYTCVLYTVAPPTLQYNVTSDNSTIVRVQSQTNNLKSITISWQDASSNVFATNTNNLLPESTYAGGGGDDLASNTGILRATLIPLTGLNRSNLTTQSQTVFLYPQANASQANTIGQQAFQISNTPSDDNQGVFANGNCNAGNNVSVKPEHCSVTITGLDSNPGVGGISTFYLRLRTLYRPSSVVSISGITTSNQPATLINEQAVIDATGKADDVLRRIQVRVPLSVSTNRPEFAIETTDSVCKRLLVYSGGLDIAPPAGLASVPSSCQTH